MMGFEADVERYGRRVYTFARYLVGDRRDAEEVAQDVLVRLWRHGAEIEPDGLPGWLLRVTRNACYDLLRRRKAATGHESDGLDGLAAEVASAEPRPDERAEAADVRRSVLAALARLDEPYKSVLVLREVQGLQYQEISDALELPLNTIRVYIHRGRRRLREMLKEVHGHVPAH